MSDYKLISSEKVDGVIRRIYGKPVVVDSVKLSDFKEKGEIYRAQVRQEYKVETLYPKVRTSSNLQDNIFSLEDFGSEDEITTKYDTVKTGVTWMVVPKGTEPAKMEEMIHEANYHLQITYSRDMRDVVDDGQMARIERGLSDWTTYFEKYVIKDAETKEYILFEGDIQFRRANLVKPGKPVFRDLRVKQPWIPPTVSTGDIIGIEGADIIEDEKL